MIKAAMIGGGFQHQNCISINNKVSPNFQWTKGPSYDIEIFLDDALFNNRSTMKTNRFGWIFESNYFSHIEKHKALIYRYKDQYDLILTHNRELINIEPNLFKFIPANAFWIKNPEIANKNRLVSFIASHKNITVGHKLRLSLIQKYRSKTDTYGFMNPIDYKEQALRDYMFSFSIENDSYSSYFTEKILDCFAMGTVPIYWGSPDISDFFNKDGIIFLDDLELENLSYDLYYSKIEYIRDNFERVKNYEILEERVYDLLKDRIKT